MCFDLDPDSGLIADAVRAALKVKQALDALELVSYAKTSGGKGLHVFVPIVRGPGHGGRHVVREGARDAPRGRLAEGPHDGDADRGAQGPRLPRLVPERVRADGRLALLREAAPPRARLDAARLERGRRPSLRAEDFTIGNFAARLKKRDPWADFFRRRQALEPALDALKRL